VPGRESELRDLAKRIRASRVLSGSAKRQWLAVLPHLRPEDRARLQTILDGDAGARVNAPHDA
jgi:hypothetical protein